MTSFRDKIKEYLDSLINLRYLVGISSLLFFFVIGAAFLLVYQNAKLMRDQINDDFNQQQLILARQVSSQIDAILSDIELEIKGFLNRNGREENAFSTESDLKEILEKLQSKGLMELGIIENNEVQEKVALAGILPSSPSEIISSCALSRRDGKLVLGDLKVEPAESGYNRVVSYLCAGMGRTQNREKFIYLKLDVSSLISFVAHDIRSGKTGYAWAIDDRGTFLYHPERDFIGKNAFTAREERKPYISFKQINKIMQEQMVRGEEGTGTYISGWHRGIEGEVKKLIAFTPVKSIALPEGKIWSIAVAAPTIEVASAVHKVYLRHFTAEAALIIGMFLFSMLVGVYQYKISQALKERVKRTESDLHETERIYQRVVEQATDLIYILSLDMRIVILNRHSIEVFSGLVLRISDGGMIPDDADLSSPELYIGRSINELMSEADASFLRRKIDEVLEKKKTISYEHWIPLKNRKVHLSTKLVPIRNDEEEIVYILGISRDVTEKTELDQRIYNTEKLASIGTLAAGVAHEINNPLAVVLGFTDLLLEKFPPNAPEYEDLKIIEANAKTAKKVVENLLTFARITEGLEDTVEVKSSIETVINIVKNTLMTKKIELETNIEEGLPRVKGDSREFQQVIFNLINNSVAAMEKSGGKLTIKSWLENGWVNISVSDTGIGIPDKIKPHIFEPFFTTKKVGEGTGLGLSLCYGIVKKYGGKITFNSVSLEDNPAGPSGTTFTVSLPIISDDEQGGG